MQVIEKRNHNQQREIQMNTFKTREAARNVVRIVNAKCSAKMKAPVKDPVSGEWVIPGLRHEDRKGTLKVSR